MNAGLSALLDFLLMDGYALFVWGSLGMCALVMAAEVLWLRARRAALLRQDSGPIEKMAQIEQRRQGQS